MVSFSSPPQQKFAGLHKKSLTLNRRSNCDIHCNIFSIIPPQKIEARNVEAEITCMLLFTLPPHPRATLAPPRERVSLSFKCDITYKILVGSGLGFNSDGDTPNVSIQSCVQSSFAFAMMDHERQTHEARERVRASQKERI